MGGVPLAIGTAERLPVFVIGDVQRGDLIRSVPPGCEVTGALRRRHHRPGRMTGALCTQLHSGEEQGDG